MTKINNEGVFCPNSYNELIEILADFPSDGCIIAGGTDLVIKLQKNIIHPSAFLVLGKIPQLNKIEYKSNYLWIGSCVTMTQLADYSFPFSLQSINDAALEVGSVQIRNLATIGGNIANASPASDLQPVLMLLDGLVVIVGPDKNIYEKKINDFIVDSGKTTLNYNEVILGFKIPVFNNLYKVSIYKKLAYTKKVSISRIGMAISIDINTDKETINNATIYVGSISKKTIMANSIASCLIGQKIFSIDYNNYLEKATEVVTANSPRKYKTYAIKGLAIDTLDLLIARSKNFLSLNN